MSRPIRLERLALILLTVATILLLIANVWSAYVAMQWRNYALITAAQLELCKTQRVPFPRPGAMITSDAVAGAD